MARRSPAFVLVHVVWATARRRPVLAQHIDDRLAGLLGRKARDLGCLLLAAGCATDHVHALLRLAPVVAFADLVGCLKGASSHDINEARVLDSHLRWQAGYWAESFGPADLDPLVAYLRRQRDGHDDSHPAENWLRDEPAEGGL